MAKRSTISLSVSPETHAVLAARAAALDLSVPAYLDRLVARDGPARPRPRTAEAAPCPGGRHPLNRRIGDGCGACADAKAWKK